MKKLIAPIVCLAASTLSAQEPPEMEKPGEHHKHLEMMAGTWDVKSKFYMIPGQTIEMTGVEVAKMQPGGFWLISDITGKFMGAPFHGHSVLGYDAQRKGMLACGPTRSPHTWSPPPAPAARMAR